MATQAPPNPAALDDTQHPSAVSPQVCGEGPVGFPALLLSAREVRADDQG